MKTALLLLACACAAAPSTSSPAAIATAEQQVRELLAAITRDLAHDGPTGWLMHFAPTGFAMASEGAVVFHDFAEAETACREMARQFGRMDLAWSEVRVQAFSADAAAFAASYREDMHRHEGATVSIAGYCTGVAVRTIAGWQVQQLHWSTRAPASSAP